MVFCFSLCTELSFCLIPLSNFDLSWNSYPFVFPMSVPFDLGVGMCPIKTQSLCFPWIGVPGWLLSHQGFGDTMLCFLACDCWLFLDSCPAAVWTGSAHLLEEERPRGTEEAFRHRWFRSSQLPGNLFPGDAGTNSVVTTQLSLAQLSDH